MISTQNKFILILSIVSLAWVQTVAFTSKVEALNTERAFKVNNREAAYVYFDRMMTKYLHWFMARLENDVDNMTFKDELMLNTLLGKLLKMRQEIEEKLKKETWHLRRGR
jgi:hypothetical protein